MASFDIRIEMANNQLTNWLDEKRNETKRICHHKVVVPSMEVLSSNKETRVVVVSPLKKRGYFVERKTPKREKLYEKFLSFFVLFL